MSWLNPNRHIKMRAVTDTDVHASSFSRLFDIDPNTAAWDLRPDGSWVRRTIGPDGEPPRDLQEMLIEVLASLVAANWKVGGDDNNSVVRLQA